ncbi:chromatin structure-remodeling complex subunit RSC7, partial [Coemansia sp. RSA 2708]
MRRSTRALAKKAELDEDTAAVNGIETPTRSRRGRAASRVSQPWSGASSPLSSLSTPASTVGRTKTRLRNQAHGRSSGTAHDGSGDEAGGSDDEGSSAAVSSLLSQAAAVIRDEVSNNRLAEDNADEQPDDATGRSTRSRAASSAKRRRRAGSQDESPSATPASRRRLALAAGNGVGSATSDDDGSAASPATNGAPRKRGRPSRQELERRRQTEAVKLEAASPTSTSANTPAQTPGAYLQTPTASTRARRPAANGANGHGGSDSSDDNDDESDKDPAGEAKIDRDGYLQGGREFICPVFRSPFRHNTRRQYVLTMDCCRYTGARDSYMLFKQHPRMRRVETTQEERDFLADRMMIPKVTRFRPIALITARTAFREFGARIIKNGRYVVDDYWEEAKRREARHAEGTLVANMSVYHSVMAAQAAGVTPGSTRKVRRTTPLRGSNEAPGRGPATPTRSMSGYGNPAQANGAVVSSWVQLEAQQRMQQQQLAASGVQSPMTTAAQMRAGGLTMANALQQQTAGAMQGPQMQLMPQPDIVDTDSDDAAKLALSKPVFRKLRSPETADAAFEAVAAAHRAQFADNHGFVDGAPLVRSLATSWPRATSLTNKLKQKRAGSFARADSEESAPPAAPEAGSEDSFGPMAYASGKLAREFNASVRLWREDNGCTWIDPHTGIRQIPANLQPTTVRVERLDTGSSRWRRAGKTRIEPLVS